MVIIIIVIIILVEEMLLVTFLLPLLAKNVESVLSIRFQHLAKNRMDSVRLFDLMNFFDGVSRIGNVRVFAFLKIVEKLQSFHV